MQQQPAGFSEGQLAIGAVVRMGKEAQGDLGKFYRMVMKHEITKKPLEPAPHQLVLFSFIQHHHFSVVRQPIGTAKTFSMAAFALFQLGNDVTQRGLFASKTQGQSSKVVSNMVADYITEKSLNRSLSLVFPELRRSQKSNDPWTRDKITVQRPPGIRDPSLTAVGLDMSVQGSRVSWLCGDDLLDLDNTRTKEAREQTIQAFISRPYSRLDLNADASQPPRAVVTNTPWDREDLTYYLEKELGWASITMDIYGNLFFVNAEAAWLHKAEAEGLIRPSTLVADAWRLAAHDPDPEEKKPLWPERYPIAKIEHAKRRFPPHDFARFFLCQPFDERSQRCQREWIERCKRTGMGLKLVNRYVGSNPTYMGVDLAIGKGGKHDRSSFFVFEVLPDGIRRPLWLQSGRMSGPDIVDLVIDMHDRYRARVAVENNGAQEYLLQFAVEKRKDLRIEAHTTGDNKASLDFGVESIFTEVRNGAWAIPCDVGGACDPEVQRWIDDMLFYQPTRHTGDLLMACWIGRELARTFGHQDPTFNSTARSEWKSQSMNGGF